MSAGQSNEAKPAESSGQVSQSGWIVLWAAAIIGVIIVFVILVAFTNP